MNTLAMNTQAMNTQAMNTQAMNTQAMNTQAMTTQAMTTQAMNTERKIRTEEQPLIEKARQHEALLQHVAADARSLASTYSKETLVPEGGE